MSVIIPKSVTNISNYAFAYCSGLKSVTIPNSVTDIGNYAFSGCTCLTSIDIPNSIISIGEKTFSDCSDLTSVTIPNSVTSIGSNAFYGCSSLSDVYVTDLVAWCNINFGGEYSNPFYYAQHLFIDGEEVIDLVIPDGVTSICSYLFYHCSSLNSITIPSTVTSIGEKAFANIPDLTDVYCYPESIPATTTNPFEGSYIEGVTLHVPEASISLYKKTGFWKTFKYIVPIVEAPSQKCATPTIAFVNGKLTFTCETEGVEYVYSFSSDNFRTKNSSDNPLASILRVSVYATKEDYADSEVATLDIDVSALKGDINGDGQITIADVVGIVDIILGNDGSGN